MGLLGRVHQNSALQTTERPLASMAETKAILFSYSATHVVSVALLFLAACSIDFLAMLVGG